MLQTMAIEVDHSNPALDITGWQGYELERHLITRLGRDRVTSVTIERLPLDNIQDNVYITIIFHRETETTQYELDGLVPLLRDYYSCDDVVPMRYMTREGQWCFRFDLRAPRYSIRTANIDSTCPVW